MKAARLPAIGLANHRFGEISEGRSRGMFVYGGVLDVYFVGRGAASVSVNGEIVL